MAGSQKWGYIRIMTGTILGGVLGFYVMHRVELSYKVPTFSFFFSFFHAFSPAKHRFNWGVFISFSFGGFSEYRRWWMKDWGSMRASWRIGRRSWTSLKILHSLGIAIGPFLVFIVFCYFTPFVEEELRENLKKRKLKFWVLHFWLREEFTFKVS